MKEFQNQVKYAVKASAPDREAIRHAVKEGQFLVKTEPVREESAVGSLFRTVGAIAAVFLAVIGVFVASVLVEQTKRPVGAGVSTSDEVLYNDTTVLSDPITPVGTLYPLAYRVDGAVEMMENPTDWNTVLQGLSEGTIKDRADDVMALDHIAENITTKHFYEMTGCELFCSLDELGRHTGLNFILQDDAVWRYNTGRPPFDPVPLVNGETKGFLYSAETGSGLQRIYIFYYNLNTHSSIPLLIYNQAQSDISDLDEPTFLYYLAYEDWMLSVEPIYLEDSDDLKVRVYSMRWEQEGYLYTETAENVYIGTLYYSRELGRWSYVAAGEAPIESDTAKPITEEPPVTQEPEVTISAWDDAHLLDLYPLNYRTAYERPLWEGRTSGEELAEKLNNGEIVFAPSSESSKNDGLWEASDIKNVTTKELYKICGTEMVLISLRPFLLEENVLYPVDDNALANAGGILSFCYVPVQMGSSHGVIVSVSRYHQRMDYNSIDADTISHVITYYDTENHIEKRLFTESVSISELYGITGEVGKMFPHVNFHGIGDTALFSIPGDGFLALYKVSESEEGCHYQLITFFDVKNEYRDVFDKETNQTSAILYITDIGSYYLVGDLYYNDEEAVWSFLLNDEPAPDVPSIKQ